MASDDEESSSTPINKYRGDELVRLRGHEGHWLHGHFGEQCARVSDKHMLEGKFSRQDVLNHISSIIRGEEHKHGMSMHYVGLTTNKLHYRFHEMDSASHFGRFRSVFLICRARSSLLRRWESFLVPALKNYKHAIQNSNDRGGSGVRNTNQLCSLYLCSTNSNVSSCECNWCMKESNRQQEESESHLTQQFWFPAPPAKEERRGMKEEKQEGIDDAKKEDAENAKKEEAKGGDEGWVPKKRPRWLLPFGPDDTTSTE